MAKNSNTVSIPEEDESELCTNMDDPNPENDSNPPQYFELNRVVIERAKRFERQRSVKPLGTSEAVDGSYLLCWAKILNSLLEHRSCLCVECTVC